MHGVIDVGHQADLVYALSQEGFGNGKLHGLAVGADGEVELGDQGLSSFSGIKTCAPIAVDIDVEFGAHGPTEDQMTGRGVVIGIDPEGCVRPDVDLALEPDDVGVIGYGAVEFIAGDMGGGGFEALILGPFAQDSVEGADGR